MGGIGSNAGDNIVSVGKQEVNLDELKRKARIAGVLYLIIIVCAGFSQGVVRAGALVPGDATATAANIASMGWLFRAGFVTDLIAFICDVGVSVILYQLLMPVSRTLSMIAASFRLIAHPAIGSLNLLNHFAAWRVLESPTMLTGFEMSQIESMALGFLEAHHMGYLIAGALFGIHCLLLGYLLYKSNLFPKTLGILLVLASVGYIVESFGFVFWPEYQTVFATLVGMTAGIGEVGLCLWLLIKGVKTTGFNAIKPG